MNFKALIAKYFRKTSLLKDFEEFLNPVFGNCER